MNHKWLLFLDKTLDEIEQLIDTIVTYGRSLTADDQEQLAGSDQLEVGQQVLVRSSANGGDWRKAVVISVAPR